MSGSFRPPKKSDSDKLTYSGQNFARRKFDDVLSGVLNK